MAFTVGTTHTFTGIGVDRTGVHTILGMAVHGTTQDGMTLGITDGTATAGTILITDGAAGMLRSTRTLIEDLPVQTIIREDSSTPLAIEVLQDRLPIADSATVVLPTLHFQAATTASTVSTRIVSAIIAMPDSEVSADMTTIASANTLSLYNVRHLTITARLVAAVAVSEAEASVVAAVAASEVEADTLAEDDNSKS